MVIVIHAQPTPDGQLQAQVIIEGGNPQLAQQALAAATKFVDEQVAKASAPQLVVPTPQLPPNFRDILNGRNGTPG